ncbi:hypothetical protein IQ266_17770 [filamentous cyanobacterium LEGE 11480]|uniref:Uncharacterized protein n=1 Tax=Romeriopsis navalis LEGE 11480 TaxID=2777977 RepID=A0A928VT34_9CYAN|nr:hypothetical protein [Romeriopsis navalis]MBE9031584.1 hypothetical protein [Romeriopsis navalis LEGE 11480]
MMRQLRFVLAGTLISLGAVLSLLCLVAAIAPGQTEDQRTSAVGVMLIVGAPPLVIGGALWMTGRQRDQARAEDRLQSTFFQVLQQGQGRMSILDFAMASKLDGDAAKAYLDDRAREFNADFDVNDDGAVLYCFNTALPAVAALQPDEVVYDVVLQDYPARQRQAIAAAITQLSDLSDFQVKESMRQAKKRPTAIANGVSQTVAESLRERLEGLGATVLVILR